MNRMQWKLAAGAALLGLCSFAACAQSTSPATDATPAPHNNWRHGGMGPERELERLTHMLTLTADQQTGVKALLEQQSTQFKALRAQSRTQTEATGNTETAETRQAGMTQMDQIRDETNTKISALLDDNQKKTFADMIARRKAAMARHESREGNPPPSTGPGGI